jgi:hypothetical protein
LESVHHRHHDIQNNQIYVPASDDLKTLTAARRADGGKLMLGQEQEKKI